MIVAGLGCRRGTGAPLLAAALEAALRVAGQRIEGVGRLATSERKRGEPGIRDLAALLRLPLVAVPDAALSLAADRVAHRSARVAALFGVPSVAEAAALVSAGPSGRLLAPRTALGPATCALAWSEELAP